MIRVGISGWRYPPWRGDFYPRGLPQRRELGYAAGRLSTIEINGSFYSLQRPGSYQRWHDETPEGFVFALKGSRFVTHFTQLTDPQVALANFFASGPLALGDKFGPVLWQLPPRTRFDPVRLAAFFEHLPRSTTAAARLARLHDHRVDGRALTDAVTERPLQHVLEVRHTSFLTDDFPHLLREHDIGVVVADSAGLYPVFDATTSDVVYVRLHGDTELYVSGYTPAALDAWAERVRGWAREHDVYVYFDNDAKVHAPKDAMALAERLGLSWPLG